MDTTGLGVWAAEVVAGSLAADWCGWRFGGCVLGACVSRKVIETAAALRVSSMWNDAYAIGEIVGGLRSIEDCEMDLGLKTRGGTWSECDFFTQSYSNITLTLSPAFQPWWYG